MSPQMQTHKKRLEGHKADEISDIVGDLHLTVQAWCSPQDFFGSATAAEAAAGEDRPSHESESTRYGRPIRLGLSSGYVNQQFKPECFY